MNRHRSFFLFAFLLCLFNASVAQRPGNPSLLPDAKEDEHDFLLYQSQKLKTEAIVAAATGPLLTGIGIYLLSKESSISISGSGGWISVSENNSPNRVYGTILATVGTLTTISIVPLLVKSSKAKTQAMLLVSDQSTTLFRSRIAVPSLGLQIRF